MSDTLSDILIDKLTPRYGEEALDTAANALADELNDTVVDAELGSGSRAALEAIANLPDEVEARCETDSEGEA